MNERQATAIRLLIADPRRDLYEGSNGGKQGNGQFWVTYSADETYAPLNRGEIAELLRDGVIRRKWPDCDGCFILTTPNAAVQRPSAEGAKVALEPPVGQGQKP